MNDKHVYNNKKEIIKSQIFLDLQTYLNKHIELSKFDHVTLLLKALNCFTIKHRIMFKVET